MPETYHGKENPGNAFAPLFPVFPAQYEANLNRRVDKRSVPPQD
jgi:hypothetical protein